VERMEAREERVAREEGRVGLAWQLLTTKAAGNSGKGRAISYLVSEKRQLQDIDISGNCNGATPTLTYLQSLRAPAGDFTGSNFNCVSADGAVLTKANFHGAQLRDGFFFLSDFESASFANSDLEGIVFFASHLEDAIFFDASLKKASFQVANISNVHFSTDMSFDENTLIRAWAWSDHRPSGVPSKSVYFACDPKSRKKYNALLTHIRSGGLFNSEVIAGADATRAVVIAWSSNGSMHNITLPPEPCTKVTQSPPSSKDR